MVIGPGPGGALPGARIGIAKATEVLSALCGSAGVGGACGLLADGHRYPHALGGKPGQVAVPDEM